jgi:cytochrome b6-f complex iron-sulfur subunit
MLRSCGNMTSIHVGLEHIMQASEQSSPQPEQMNRRSVLTLGLGALGLVGTFQMGASTLQFLSPRPVEGAFGGIITAGPVDSFPPGTVVEFPDGRFFLVRLEDSGFLALYRRCTHLGCAVGWHAGEARFSCPCHGSHFDIAGDVQNPPAPRALDTFAVTIEDNLVLVDTSRPIQRDTYTPDQLVYAG